MTCRKTACGFAGNVVLRVGIVVLLYNEIVPATAAPYLGLVLIVWKLAVSYWLFTLQSRSFGLYQYFGGPVRSGALVVIAAFFLRPRLVAELPLFWVVVLG